jgi:pimeloyl-ACP methyl ester carboxylesterase
MTTTVTQPPPEGVEREGIALGDGEVQVLRGGDGPALVFLHASGGAGMWLPVHARLAQSFTVHAPDHPGFGGSGDFESLQDVTDLALHYVDLLGELGLERPAVVGTSFGGWIAAELAALAPQAVGKLVLVDPVGLYVEGAPVADLFIMDPARKVASLFADPSRAAGLVPEDPDLDTIIAMARDEAAFARFAWQPFCHDPRLPRLLPRIEAPTLVLWGEQDAVVPLAHGERYAELIPGARLKTIPDCGHAAAIERPEVVATESESLLLT